MGLVNQRLLKTMTLPDKTLFSLVNYSKTLRKSKHVRVHWLGQYVCSLYDGRFWYARLYCSLYWIRYAYHGKQLMRRVGVGCKSVREIVLTTYVCKEPFQNQFETLICWAKIKRKVYIFARCQKVKFSFFILAGTWNKNTRHSLRLFINVKN